MFLLFWKLCMYICMYVCTNVFRSSPVFLTQLYWIGELQITFYIGWCRLDVDILDDVDFYNLLYYLLLLLPFILKYSRRLIIYWTLRILNISMLHSPRLFRYNFFVFFLLDIIGFLLGSLIFVDYEILDINIQCPYRLCCYMNCWD